MHSIESIYKAVKFIDDNLKEEITVGDIADAVYYSLYHFCRMFNNIINHTPYDYLIRRRLSESALELLTTNKKVIDIAFDYKFNSHESFSRAFKKMFLIQPTQFRKKGITDNRLLMPSLTLDYLKYINKNKYIKPFILEKEFNLMGFVNYINNIDDAGSMKKIWQILNNELNNINYKVKDPDYYSLIINNDNNQGFFYMAGINTININLNNIKLFSKYIPLTKYLCFIHNGSLNDKKHSLNYIYHTWIPKSNISIDYNYIIFDMTKNIINHENKMEIYVPINNQH